MVPVPGWAEPKTKTVLETRTEWNLLNDVKAIWLRNPKDISDTEYIEFYKSVGKVRTQANKSEKAWIWCSLA